MYLFIYLFMREKGEKKVVVPLIYACVGGFLYVPWPGCNLLMYQEDALTNKA